MEASATRSGPVRYAPPLTTADQAAMRGRAAFVGPSERIVEALHSVRERAGVPIEFVARSFFPTLEYHRQVELMERLAQEVGQHL